MAIASYFSKNALAIQHVLKNGNFSEFETLLNSHVIEIAFDECVLGHEGNCSFDLLIKILARLYPRLKFQPLDEKVVDLVADATVLAKKVNCLIEITEALSTVTLVIGNTRIEAENERKVFYLGSDGWKIRFSDKNPVGCGTSQYPFAAGTSACIAAANVFKYVFRNFLRKDSVDKEVEFSLLDAYQYNGETIECNDLGLFHLVGIGAIGNGCLWTLSKLPGVKGKLITVDYQKIDLSNIQRYVEVHETDKKKQKGIVAIRSLKNTSIVVKHVNSKWNQFVAGTGDYKREIVITALDSIRDRIAVHASLPKIIFNGYTDDGILGVARHVNFLNHACMSCMYTPKGPVPSRSEIIAKDLGIPETKIRDLLYLNKKVDEGLLTLISIANNISYEEIKKFKGVPIESFYSEFICAGTLIRIKGASSDSNRTIEAPLAFQSALAGILLIADLFLYRAGISLAYNRTHYNPLALIRPGINFTHHNLEKENGCICSDSIYREAYSNKWAG